MIWSFSADGDVLLSSDAADLSRGLDVTERSIVQTCKQLRFSEQSRTGRGTGHVGIRTAAESSACRRAPQETSLFLSGCEVRVLGLIAESTNEGERKTWRAQSPVPNVTALRLTSQ